MRIKLLLYVFLQLCAVAAIAAECSVCGKTVRGKYLKANDKIFCSQTCLDKTLPHCAECDKIIKGAYFSRDGKFYCSQECLSRTWPQCRGCGRHSASGAVFKGSEDMFFCSECVKLPHCFSCLMPAYMGSTLEDGRTICPVCMKSAVTDIEEANRIFEEVRGVMRDKLGISTNHNIRLRMVDLPAIQRRSPDYSHGIEMGLYVYDATVKTITTNKLPLLGGKPETTSYRTNESYTIFFLDHTPVEKLREVFAHELGHDWLQKFYPDIVTLKIKEGFCELCAYMVNELMGQARMNRRISNNPDEIYGGGFRLLYEQYEQGGWEGVRRFLRKNNS